MKDQEIILEHSLDAYMRRKYETPHTFFGYKNTISSNFTGIDWGERNPELIKRTKRIEIHID